jgi:hypothetical protein
VSGRHDACTPIRPRPDADGQLSYYCPAATAYRARRRRPDRRSERSGSGRDLSAVDTRRRLPIRSSACRCRCRLACPRRRLQAARRIDRQGPSWSQLHRPMGHGGFPDRPMGHGGLPDRNVQTQFVSYILVSTEASFSSRIFFGNGTVTLLLLFGN